MIAGGGGSSGVFAEAERPVVSNSFATANGFRFFFVTGAAPVGSLRAAAGSGFCTSENGEGRTGSRAIAGFTEVSVALVTSTRDGSAACAARSA